MRERSASGQLDADETWEQFRALAATSEQAGLAELAARFRAMPGKDRLALAGTIAGMLAPVEWPAAWKEPRLRLVRALDELLRELKDGEPGALPTLLDLGGDRDLYASGRREIATARDLLRTPCRRDEIRIAGWMCEIGSFSCWQALERTVQRLSRNDATEAIVTARRRYASAHGVYVEAARAMNDACGAVLIGIADLRFPSLEAA
jgi:hypothetical protein